MTSWPPTFGICGWSGSGKTTLIESLLRDFRASGLTVAVVKHQAHGLAVDRDGKDTDRFFRAGATVAAHDRQEGFLRFATREDDLDSLIVRVGTACDLVLVEGHKTSGIPKIWLPPDDQPEPPVDITNVVSVLPKSEDRAPQAKGIVEGYLADFHRNMEVRAAVLIGGKSQRMGRPKQTLEVNGTAMIESVTRVAESVAKEVLLVGNGPIPQGLKRLPVLPDAPGVDGPLSGLLTALRWGPTSRWLVMACDLPFVTEDAARWLLSQAGPARWAVLPFLERPDYWESLFAVYDPPVLPRLEAGARRGQLAMCHILRDEKVASPQVPSQFREAWTNVNTPRELQRARAASGRRGEQR